MTRIRLATSLACILIAFVGCCLAFHNELEDSLMGLGQDALEQLERTVKIYNNKVRTNIKLPHVFDFETYKRAFKKTYASSLEEMVRLKLFLANKFRVFVTRIRYRYRQMPYYLGINSRSDWTEAELEASKMKIVDRKGKEAGDERDPSSSPSSSEPRSESTVDDPEAIISKIATKTRMKRQADTDETSEKKKESRSVDELAETPTTGSKQNKSDVAAKQDSKISDGPGTESKLTLDELDLDPDYKPLYLRHYTLGKKRYYSKAKEQTEADGKKSLLSMIGSFFDSVCSRNHDDQYPDQDVYLEDEQNNANDPVKDNRPDGIWVDHRKSNCMFPSEDQGICGSCYAFATIAYLEWAYCKETGLKIKMSEQYIVDCGKMLEELNGCDGGLIHHLGAFVNNFGLELGANYPYTGTEGTCGYDYDVPMISRGDIRLNMFTLNLIPMNLFEEHLADAPIIISIGSEGLFYLYGGGVWDGKGCGNKGDHAVLLVGHGREDGQEFWLIRNSYGGDYGENGYVKLNKDSDCIHPKQGFVLGSFIHGKVYLYASNNTNKAEMRGRPGGESDLKNFNN